MSVNIRSNMIPSCELRIASALRSACSCMARPAGMAPVLETVRSIIYRESSSRACLAQHKITDSRSQRIVPQCAGGDGVMQILIIIYTVLFLLV